jgi:hypothetical protein
MVGGTMTVADLATFGRVLSFKARKYDNIPADLLDKFPLINGAHNISTSVRSARAAMPARFIVYHRADRRTASRRHRAVRARVGAPEGEGMGGDAARMNIDEQVDSMMFACLSRVRLTRRPRTAWQPSECWPGQHSSASELLVVTCVADGRS